MHPQDGFLVLQQVAPGGTDGGGEGRDVCVDWAVGERRKRELPGDGRAVGWRWTSVPLLVTCNGGLAEGYVVVTRV